MTRLVLIYDDSDVPASEIETIARIPHVQILDSALGNMLLIEGDEPAVRSALADRPKWQISVERQYSIPRPIPRPK